MIISPLTPIKFHCVHGSIAALASLIGDPILPILAKEETLVSFAEMKDEELKAYIETGEPFDKAGGYGIQARWAARLFWGCPGKNGCGITRMD